MSGQVVTNLKMGDEPASETSLSNDSEDNVQRPNDMNVKKDSPSS